ncbi:PfkB family carbohydrate kinase [Mesorhizobium sp. NPDC059054]|uniref:PfkB family carbohydrate kinase n=1 Tax=Mesorhizobium sp. NPDC059054 TaxID=3346711 RepID=UPI0036BBE7E9
MTCSRKGCSVFCVGLALQDTILTLDRIPDRAAKVYAKGRREVGGGPAATAAVTVARLGGHASIAARTGEDNIGATIRDEFEAAGVDTAWLRAFPGIRSSGAVVLVDSSGERLIVAYADPELPSAANWLEPEDWGDAVLCDLTWPEGALRGLNAAQAAGIPSVLDADISRHAAGTVAAIVDAAGHVIFSRPGLTQFTGTESIEEGLRIARRPSHIFVGVTDGADGLFWLEDGELRNAPPPSVDVVDTTGAGDAFHGAFALALAHGRPIADAIVFSNTVAALKCTRPGGRAGLPDPAALCDFAPELDLDWLMVGA